VGHQEFGFTANKEGTCDVVRLPPAGSDLPAVEVGRLHQRLYVQARTTEAVTPRPGRLCVLLPGWRRRPLRLQTQAQIPERAQVAPDRGCAVCRCRRASFESRFPA